MKHIEYQVAFIGALAKCKSGRIGLITGKQIDGTWTGKHLESDVYGRRWQSKRPRVVGIAYTDLIDEMR